MSKWKTNLKKVLAGASLLLLPFSASAYYGDSSCDFDPCCGPTYDCCGCGGFKFGVDFLYWKPCIDDLTYAASFNDFSFSNEISLHPCVKYKDICTKWEPGVRVMASLGNMCNCFDLMASFTYMNSCDEDHCSTLFGEEGTNFFQSPLVHPFVASISSTTTSGVYDFVKSNWKSCYYNGDLLLGFNFNPANCCCLNFKPYAGITGIYIEQDMKFSGFNSEFSEFIQEDIFLTATKWCNDYWGVGLKMGTYLEQTLCNCISVFANGSASLVAGKTCRASNKQVVPVQALFLQTSPGFASTSRSCHDDCDDDCNFGYCDSEDFFCLTYKNDDRCLFVPGYHIQAGFKYASNMCGCNFALRAGYEFLNWHNVPNPRVFSGTQFGPTGVDVPLFGLSNSSSPNTRTYGFHGLFAGLEVGF